MYTSAKTNGQVPAFRQFISTEMRTDNGPGFWLTSDRPFADVATDYTRAAYRSIKPVPSVRGTVRRQPIPTP